MKIYKHKITGEKITEDTYNNLWFSDQMDYEYYGRAGMNDDSITDDLIGLGVGLLLGGLFDGGDSGSSDSSSDSFDGFGGGDFGGGGASGEW